MSLYDFLQCILETIGILGCSDFILWFACLLIAFASISIAIEFIKIFTGGK